MQAGAGNDLLTSDAAKKILTGGTGSDRFIVVAVTDSTLGSYGRDRITDFVVADGDRIDVGRLDTNALLGGNQNFTFIGDAAFTGALGELRAVQVGNTVQLPANISADLRADFSIQLLGHRVLTATEFIR